jgi:hypothetical protein
MAFETGRRFSADVKNPSSSATGLIQFMKATAFALGTTVEKLRLMTPEDQINYVFKYFKDVIEVRGPIKTLEDHYMAILFPKAVGKPDTYAIFLEGSDAYVVNAGLDTNRDHVVTKAEAASKVRALLQEGEKFRA